MKRMTGSQLVNTWRAAVADTPTTPTKENDLEKTSNQCGGACGCRFARGRRMRLEQQLQLELGWIRREQQLEQQQRR